MVNDLVSSVADSIPLISEIIDYSKAVWNSPNLAVQSSILAGTVVISTVIMATGVHLCNKYLWRTGNNSRVPNNASIYIREYDESA